MAPTAIAVRRIHADVRRVQTELAESGIYWVADETNLTQGWAIICGMEGTPYHGGFFCFDVHFPDNYPFDPPSFKYLTNDGRVRFNPNLYINGKVCLSLLNTWAGEQWSAIQSLASVLQSIQTMVLCDHPLHNEPAYNKVTTGHPDSLVYDRMVTHSVLKTAILEQLRNPLPYVIPILPQLKAFIAKERDAVLTKYRALTVWDDRSESFTFFNMRTTYTFRQLIAELEGLDLS
jgi:ubiquitin-protein ligase